MRAKSSPKEKEKNLQGSENPTKVDRTFAQNTYVCVCVVLCVSYISDMCDIVYQC